MEEMNNWQKDEAKRPKRSFGKGVLVGVLSSCLVMALVLGSLFVGLARTGGAVNLASQIKLQALGTIINRFYYQPVDQEKLQDGMYKGLLSAIGDPYTEYYTPKEYADLMASMTGSYAGIGATMSKDEKTGKVSIVTVYEGTPAREGGLMSGDVLERVAGKETKDISLEDVVAMIRGEEGSQVDLTVTHSSGQEETLTLTRRRIEVPTVSHRMATDQIGYVRIDQFTESTARDYQKAMEDLKSQGMKAVIFDVRNNPGGMLTSVTEVLNHILPEGLSVYMTDKNGKRTDYRSDGKDELKMPIAVLTSGNTASAAEIFAGAIRDYQKGTLIGQKTFGKGIVQQTMSLPDGSAIKLTIASYYTPKGESIHQKGIEPDIQMDYSYTGPTGASSYDILKDNQVQQGIETLQSQIKTEG